MLIDAEFRGRPRKLLVQGNRNGFFYVLDRLTGELLMAEPFVKNLTWASGIGPDGRPKLLPEPRADTGRRARVPGGRRRDELAVNRVQPGDRTLLPDGAGVVRHLLQERRVVEARRIVLRRHDASARPSRTAASSFARSIFRPERSPGKCRSRAGFCRAA